MNNKSGSLLGSSDIIGKPGSEVLKKSSQDYPVPESLCIRTSKLSEEEWFFHDLLEQYEKKNYKERWLELEVYEIEKPIDLKEYCVEV